MTTTFEDDPEFGAYVANFPANRSRLLLTAGVILAAVWFVLTVVLWQVEAGLASIITVGVISVATLAVGWYVAHFWNREVVLYKRGFSYREGSAIAFIRYADVVALRQKAERVSYFGGLVRRTIYRTTMKTVNDETIVLGSVYRRVDDLSLKLEQEVTRLLKPIIEVRLRKGEMVAFGERLTLNDSGISLPTPTDSQNPYAIPTNSSPDKHLPWSEFAGCTVEGGRLVLASSSEPAWGVLPLEEIDNVRLLLDVLKSRAQQP
ncbi:MAG: DUF6585 family protein [bacterium]|nr:DUF6585 family protein [bacterium]